MKSEALSEQVADSELICRYIFSKNHFNSSRAKWPAFEPRNSEVSVHRVDNYPEDNLIADGKAIGDKRTKSLKAWVLFTALNVRTLEYPDKSKMKLDVVSEPTPHPRHANLKDLSKKNDEDWLEEAKILAERMPMTLVKLNESEDSIKEGANLDSKGNRDIK